MVLPVFGDRLYFMFGDGYNAADNHFVISDPSTNEKENHNHNYVCITTTEYEELIHDSLFLNCYHWEGWDDAIDMMGEDD